MTREFFTPERKRSIAPSIHFRERLDVAIEFLLPGSKISYAVRID